MSNKVWSAEKGKIVKIRWVRRRTLLGYIAEIKCENKWNLGGHIVETPDNRWTETVIEYPRDMKRNGGLPRHKGEEETRNICGGMTE